MRRKTAYLAWMVLALLTGSCQRTVVPEDSGDPILFSGGLVGESVLLTKADKPSASSSFLHIGSKFSLYGSWQENTSTPATDIFDQQVVECLDGTEINWGYSPLRYWRKRGIYHFCAVFPYNATTEFGTGSDRLVIKYSMHSDHYDLMAAKKNIDLSATAHPTRVVLPFQHACAAVRFLFRSGVEDANTTYHLHSFELQNLQTMGVFIFDSDNVQMSNWHPADARAAHVFQWESADNASLTIPATYAEFDAMNKPFADWNYVIPQTLTAFGSAIPSVYFSLTVNDNPTPVYSTLSLLPEDPEVTTWEPGKLYTYYIRIQRSAVSITLEVEPWDTYSVVADDILFDE